MCQCTSRYTCGNRLTVAGFLGAAFFAVLAFVFDGAFAVFVLLVAVLLGAAFLGAAFCYCR